MICTMDWAHHAQAIGALAADYSDWAPLFHSLGTETRSSLTDQYSISSRVCTVKTANAAASEAGSRAVPLDL